MTTKTVKKQNLQISKSQRRKIEKNESHPTPQLLSYKNIASFPFKISFMLAINFVSEGKQLRSLKNEDLKREKVAQEIKKGSRVKA